jgi:Na+-transporting methylmalonyl-CoA/oxaloacetate decarboxylase gamma subunit
MIQVSLQNVLDGHGIAISLTGMLIVFSGLVLISLFITQLPNLLALYDRLTTRRSDQSVPVPTAPEASDREEDIMTAIALVIHLELERLTGESQKITISRRPGQGSIWASAGKMRSLSQRSIHA